MSIGPVPRACLGCHLSMWAGPGMTRLAVGPIAAQTTNPPHKIHTSSSHIYSFSQQTLTPTPPTPIHLQSVTVVRPAAGPPPFPSGSGDNTNPLSSLPWGGTTGSAPSFSLPRRWRSWCQPSQLPTPRWRKRAKGEWPHLLPARRCSSPRPPPLPARCGQASVGHLPSPCVAIVGALAASLSHVATN